MYSQPIRSDLQIWFSAVDEDNSGQINFEELQSALIVEDGKTFSDRACRMMIDMFDNDKNGTINIYEFQHLYDYIISWVGIFKSFDRDSSGYIEESELAQGLQQMGYTFSPQFIRDLIRKTDHQQHRRVTMDQFIMICVQIQIFTQAFKKRDKNMTGSITIGFEDFLTIALESTI